MIKLLGTQTLTVDSAKLVPADYQYNCAVFRAKQKLWLIYRYETKYNHALKGSRLAISELDPETYQPTGEHVLVDPPTKKGIEDPRICEHKDHYYVSYCNDSKQHLMQLDADFNVLRDQRLEAQNENWCEKNWTYFSQDGRLYCVYSLQPFIVYEVLDDGSQWSLKLNTSVDHELKGQWKWGPIRGGTNPVLFGDEYYTFFHSCYFHTFQDLFDDRIYTVGLAKFSKDAPHRITHLTSQPLLWPDFDDIKGPTPCAVVFPCGAMKLRGRWLVAHGSNDYKCQLTVFDERELNLVYKKVA